MSATTVTSTPMRDAQSLTRPAFDMPQGACDSHVHIFEDPTKYPGVASPHYTRPDGSLAKLRRMTQTLSLQRYVIVQPSFYGTDNSCMLDALSAAGAAARGVVMIREDCSDQEFHAMHVRGVRALRLDLFLRAHWPIADIIAYIERSLRRARAFGWHIQFYTPGWVVRDLLPFLRDLDGDFVIDHMGYMLESDGVTAADFDRLIELIGSGRGWIKLSAPYRLAKDGKFAALQPKARAIIEAAPDRVIWGSDWPHIPDGSKDSGALLNLLLEWAPDAGARNRILVSNPARLFGFEMAADCSPGPGRMPALQSLRKPPPGNFSTEDK